MKHFPRLIVFALLLSLTACKTVNDPARMESGKRHVESALPQLAATIVSAPLSFDAVASQLEAYLRANPQAYGAAFAVDPAVAGKLFSPYVYRQKERYVRMNLDDVKYDYPKQAWYSEPKRLNQARWSAPYFDEGGGNITMITYSIPIHAKGRFLGILTTDLPVK